jgi:signal transduction histidine kinase
LSLIASQAARFLKAESVAIYGYDAKEKIIQILSGFNLPPELEHLEWIPAYSGGAVQAMLQKSPYVVEEIPAQIATAAQTGGDVLAERLQKWLQILSENYRSYLGIPLIVEDQVYGTLGIYYKHSRRTAEEEMGLAHSLGEQAALAVETARLREQIRQAAVAEERSRLARELHDAVTQTLFSASLIAEVLPRLWERDEEEAQKRLEELRLLTRSALAEMRTLLLELRPSALMEAKLSDLIQHLSDAFSGRSRVPVSLELDLSEELPLDLKVAVYRILQEALHNISKHAKAERVLVTAVQRVDSFELIVQDNGIGFDPHKIPSDHLGLGIMRERAVQIGAQFQIDSAPNKGTRIKLTWRAPEE